MVIDEPAMWNLIPEHKRERVICVAKALCQSREAEDDEDDETPNHCGSCDTPTGGSCVAFGLYGQMAIDVVEALDKLESQSKCNLFLTLGTQYDTLKSRETCMTEHVRIDAPALNHTETLLEQILLPILTQDGARVRFLCEAGEGEAVAQRVRVMLSRKRKMLEQQKRKVKRFRLHSSIHSETHEGKRFDCVIMWRSVNETHLMTETLEDLLSNGN